MTAQTPFPTHLLIETTTRCNLRCKQCAHVIGKYALADMDMTTFDKLRPLFPTLKQVALYGHGETFLYKHFFEMLAELKQYPPIVYVTTNGTLLSERVCEQLVEFGLDKLAVSLDAATPELFNDIRQGADFAQIIANLRYLNAIKKRHHRDDQPTLSIMYCAMQRNIQELPKLVRLADELNMTHGVAVMNIYEYGLHGESLAEHPEIAAPYLNEAHRLAERLAVPLGGLTTGFEEVQIAPVRLSLWERGYRNYREFKRSFNRPALLHLKISRWRARRVQPNQPVPMTSAGNMLKVRKCQDPWEFLFVDVHGNLRPCCTSHRIMGNVHTEDLVTIWNNQKYQEFRATIYTARMPEECRTCLRREWHRIPAPEA